MFGSSNCMSVPLVANIGDGNNNNGMNGWGGDWIWIILVFALIWGNNGFGGWGNGNNASGGALTRGELCQDMNFNDLQSGVRSIQTSLADGFRNIDNAACTLGYQGGQLASQTQMQIANGFGTLDASLCQVTNNLTQSINGVSSQLASCCCDLRSGLKDIQFQNAQDTCATTTAVANAARDIIENQNSGTKAILDYLCKDKIDTLQSENQALRLQASQVAQNEYLVSQLRPLPQPSYIVCNPFTGQYNGYTYTGNYGCSGCGCN